MEWVLPNYESLKVQLSFHRHSCSSFTRCGSRHACSALVIRVYTKLACIQSWSRSSVIGEISGTAGRVFHEGDANHDPRTWPATSQLLNHSSTGYQLCQNTTDLFTKNGSNNSTKIERATSEEITQRWMIELRLQVLRQNAFTIPVVRNKIKVYYKIRRVSTYRPNVQQEFWWCGSDTNWHSTRKLIIY